MIRDKSYTVRSIYLKKAIEVIFWVTTTNRPVATVRKPDTIEEKKLKNRHVFEAFKQNKVRNDGILTRTVNWS